MVETPEDNHLKFLEFARGGDLEGLLSRFEPGATMVTVQGRLEGRDAIRAYLRVGIKQMADLEFALLDVVTAGDVALERLSYSMTARTEAGDIERVTATSNVLLRRQPDGRWLIAIDHTGP